MLRWIAFDAVGTLIDPEPDVATAYGQIGRKYGSRLTAAEIRLRFRTAFAASNAACLPLESGHFLTSEVLEAKRWRWIVERVLDDVQDREPCFAELYEHFAEPTNWRLFPDVAGVLDRLRNDGLRLAIASNFDQRLHAVCRGIPELQVMDEIVVSTDVGACKPSPRFFEALLDRCDCRPDELLMVGDDYEADVSGPQRIGIPALFLDRAEDSADENSIRSLTELAEKLTHFQTRPA